MPALAHFPPVVDTALRLAEIQQAIADCDTEIDTALDLVARAVLDLIPAALGVIVRIGKRENRAGDGPVRTYVVPIRWRQDDIGEIRIQARRALTAREYGTAAILAGIAALASSAARRAGTAYDALDRYQRRFHATFSQAPVGIAHVSPEGHFLLVNDRFAAITGHSREALLREGFQRITHPDDIDADVAHVTRLLSGADDRYGMEKRYVRPDGSVIWVKLTVSLVRDVSGEPDFFVSVIEDMSAIRFAHEQAIHDPLTGLLNRRGFDERTRPILDRAARMATPVTLAFVDLDDFKRINDAHGHQAGDQCLANVARVIREEVGVDGIPARLGGDEFAILLCMAQADAERVIARVHDRLPGLAAPVSGSFGLIARIPESGMAIDALIALADRAMFDAKRAGRNCVRVAP